MIELYPMILNFNWGILDYIVAFALLATTVLAVRLVYHKVKDKKSEMAADYGHLSAITLILGRAGSRDFWDALCGGLNELVFQ